MVVIGTVKRDFNYGPGFRGQFPLELYSETTFEQMQEPAVLVINGQVYMPFDSRLGDYVVTEASRDIREALRLAGYRIDGL